MNVDQILHCGRGQIINRMPHHTPEGAVVKTISGRYTTPCPRLDYSTSRRIVNSNRRWSDWLRVNARAEAASRGLYCTIGDGYHGGDGALTPSEGDEAEMLLWGELVVDGHRVGLPEDWDKRGGMTPEEIAGHPRLLTSAEALRILAILCDPSITLRQEVA